MLLARFQAANDQLADAVKAESAPQLKKAIRTAVRVMAMHEPDACDMSEVG